MKLVHKTSIIEATVFDPLCSPWPKGIVKVTRETENSVNVSFEYVDPISKRGRNVPIRGGDYIASEFDENTLEEVARHVLPKTLVNDEYVILGEVQPQ